MALFEAGIRTDETAQARVRKWIEALRSDSDEYRQGTRWLRVYDAYSDTNNDYCCLGVACDLLDPTRWELMSDPDDKEDDEDGRDRWFWIDEAGEENARDLPTGAQAAYRLTDARGRLTHPGEKQGVAYWTLDAMNDARFTFAEIADAIEREFNEAVA